MDNVKKKMDIFFDKTAPSIVVEIGEYREGYSRIRQRGGKIRAFTEITKENVGYCKELIKLVDELRHLDGVRGGVAVSDSEYMATTLLQESTPLTQVIYSNAKEVIEHGQYIFDTLWTAAIPAEKKISEIEEGLVPEVIETIHEPELLQFKVLDLLRSAKEEILIIFSTANAFHRQERIGSLQILKDIRDTNKEIKIKLLTPKDDQIEEICKDLDNNLNFFTRFMEPISKVSILVVDRMYSIVAELRDDTKKTIAESIGLATYSNSSPTVLTYAGIFDVLWKQIELYEQLQVHENMQTEFINIAAHELRTPLQPIISVSDVIRNRIKDNDIKELLDILNRNTKRLKKLTEDILDLTKIESSSFILNKEKFSVKELLEEIIKDSRIDSTNKSMQIKLDISNNIMIYADKNRISQVITNLISNSVKFSGRYTTISIRVKRKIFNFDNLGPKESFVFSVKDLGKGIENDILGKLFTKFSTSSSQGIGLGLYISKKIIEAHGGIIWAENNENEPGATFSFIIPL